MKIVIFGAAREGLNCYFDLEKENSIVAFADNNTQKQGEKILGVEVVKPEEIPELFCDRVYVTSKNGYWVIRQQLKELGINSDMIELYESKSSADKALNYLLDSSCAYGKEEFEKKWQSIRRDYEKVNVYALVSDAIGEMIARYLWILDEQKESKELNVFIPITQKTLRLANIALLEQIKKQIYIVEAEDIPFWNYVIYAHEKEINISSIDKYIYRKEAPFYLVNKELIKFDKKELEEEQKQLNILGVKEPYVCFWSRTSTYNLNTIGREFDYDYRNMNFEDYQKTIDYLKEYGITAVRMGRAEKRLDGLNNCVDYAGLNASDFNDLALARKCTFMVCASTGAYLMAYLFRKPLLIVNHVLYSLAGGACGYTGMELFIPKKLYSISMKRFLTLNEIIEIEQECLLWGDNYRRRGIEFINNTPEEICDAVEEMIERINGTWVDTEEDRKAYERYAEIYEKMKIRAMENERNWMGGPPPFKIAASYLRNNMYLLD